MISKSAFRLCCSVSLLALPLALAACSSQHGPDSAPALLAEPNSPIADAPVPVGYKIMESKSTSKVDPVARIRIVDHSYSGGYSELQLTRFYRDQMPAHGWTFISQEQTRRDITLKFTKNTEDALVTVWHGNFDNHIRIKIDPLAPAAGK